jgi:dTDP-4-dehydrorhamnose 3,5-epimerase
MRLQPLSIPGAFLVLAEPIGDARGWFVRSFCQRTLAEYGVHFEVRQANRSFNQRAGTVRGFHVQRPPHSEQKLLRCVRGALVDAVLDLRPESPTFLRWEMVELTADNRHALLIPERCSHALLTLSDATEISYESTAPYVPAAELGVRWDDPRLAIPWPGDVRELSGKDASWPLLDESLEELQNAMVQTATPESQAGVG